MGKNKTILVLLSVLSLLFIGAADYLTGAELSFSIFYLLPILAVTWYLNRIWGIILSISGASIWITSDIYTHAGYSHFLLPYWNGFVRLAFFLAFTYLVSRTKTGWDMEKNISRTDPLTGIRNLRSFYELAGIELERAARYRHGNPFSLAYLDLDNFKTVNDSQGHNTGDRLLRLVAETMSGSLRKVDIAARLGGDEFIVLLPEADEHSAKVVLDRVRLKLLEAMKLNGWPVTFSIGVVTFHTPPGSVNDMIREVDAVMYTVKHSGKNAIQSKSV